MNVQNIFKNHKWGDQIIRETENSYMQKEEEYRKEQNKKRQIERDRRRKEYQDKINSYIAKNGPYWYYDEADTYVELNKHSSVPAMDKVNQIRAYFINNNSDIDIMMTLVGPNNPPFTVDEYHATLCDKKKYNGKDIWVYRGC